MDLTHERRMLFSQLGQKSNPKSQHSQIQSNSSKSQHHSNQIPLQNHHRQTILQNHSQSAEEGNFSSNQSTTLPLKTNTSKIRTIAASFLTRLTNKFSFAESNFDITSSKVTSSQGWSDDAKNLQKKQQKTSKDKLSQKILGKKEVINSKKELIKKKMKDKGFFEPLASKMWFF